MFHIPVIANFIIIKQLNVGRKRIFSCAHLQFKSLASGGAEETILWCKADSNLDLLINGSNNFLFSHILCNHERLFPLTSSGRLEFSFLPVGKFVLRSV